MSATIRSEVTYKLLEVVPEILGNEGSDFQDFLFAKEFFLWNGSGFLLTPSML
jgi:hypothetical protein